MNCALCTHKNFFFIVNDFWLRVVSRASAVKSVSEIFSLDKGKPRFVCFLVCQQMKSSFEQ